MTSYRFFKMAALESEICIRLLFWWRHSFRNVQIYLHTKFRWNISIHGWAVTTSGSWKRTSTILEFHFPFRFWSIHRHGHGILHRRTKFYLNRSTHGGVMTTYLFLYRYSGVEMWIVSTPKVNLLSILRMRCKNNDVNRQLQGKTPVS